MAAPKPVEFLEQLQAKQPALAEDAGELASLYQRKLWHQLTLKLEACFARPEWNADELPLLLYTNLIADFAHKLNLLKLAHFAVHVSKHVKDPKAATSFLEGVASKLAEFKLPRSDEPLLFLRMHVAQQQLEAGDAAAAKAAIEAGREQLDRMHDVDASVSAAVYYVASLLHKSRREYADFYRASMMYLGFVPADQLPPDFRLALAIDVGLAALLGEGIYGFAQLLEHPIAAALRGSPPNAWLLELLGALQTGDLAGYDALCARHAAALNAQPALVEHERRLREKATISALLALVSARPPEARRIALADVAAATGLAVDGAEFLVMKALSLKLLEGVIDEVDGVVAVSWVVPRALTRAQIGALKGRLDDWAGRVNATADALEHESFGVVEA